MLGQRFVGGGEEIGVAAAFDSFLGMVQRDGAILSASNQQRECFLLGHTDSVVA